MARADREKAAGSLEERVSRSFLADLEKVADRIASEEGAPPGASKVGRKESARLWGATDPKAPYERVLSTLLSTGLPEDAARTFVLAKTYPDLVPLLTQPAPNEAAAQALATLAEHPYRAPLVFDHADEPKEQTERAEQLERDYHRFFGQQADESAPDDTPIPVQPSASMPQMPPEPMPPSEEGA